VPTLRKNSALMTVFGTLTVTFFLLAGGQWSATCMQAAGYVGFVCGCSAIYTGGDEGWQDCVAAHRTCTRRCSTGQALQRRAHSLPCCTLLTPAATAFAEIYEESLGISMPGLRPVRFI
jgi:hypothetical protein